MRYLSIVVALAICTSAIADGHQRHVAGKLTDSAKPVIKVLTATQQETAKTNPLALDLDPEPDQIECRKVRAGRDSASRVVSRRCKTRAEFRAYDERELARLGLAIDTALLRDVRRHLQKNYDRQKYYNSRPVVVKK